jgi:dihydropyrimidinase
MYPKKGVLAVGSDADIVLWDPNAEHTISAKTHNMRVTIRCSRASRCAGMRSEVYSRGELIVRAGSFWASLGRGKRKACAGLRARWAWQ